ncbi:MAG: hypothetical protein AABZ53_04215, partial [Planctomycetota bacterium]
MKDASFEKVGTSREGVGGAPDFDGVRAGVEDGAEAEGFGLVVFAGEPAKLIGLVGPPDGGPSLELRGGEERGEEWGEIGERDVELSGDGDGVAL